MVGQSLDKELGCSEVREQCERLVNDIQIMIDELQSSGERSPAGRRPVEKTVAKVQLNAAAACTPATCN